MTVIYTETHLTSDPVYDDKNTAIFNIALSNLSIQCQVHRPENIDYIHRNQIRTGDLIRLKGVFLAPATAGLPYYIKVSSFHLAPQHQRYASPSSSALVLRGKKRRIDGFLLYDYLSDSWMASPSAAVEPEYSMLEENLLEPTPTGSSTATVSVATGTIPSTTPVMAPTASAYNDNISTATTPVGPPAIAHMTEFNGPFSEYFFMIFGEAQYICQCAQISQQQHHQREQQIHSSYQQQEITKQLQQYQLEEMAIVNTLLEQIYILYQAMDKNGLNRLDVVNFVSTVSKFVERLNELQRSCQDTIHAGLNSNQRRIILPSAIYRFYASLFC